MISSWPEYQEDLDNVQAEQKADLMKNSLNKMMKKKEFSNPYFTYMYHLYRIVVSMIMDCLKKACLKCRVMQYVKQLKKDHVCL